ncbi:TRAP transporter small permease [Bosea vaviloviae]|uniref:TRAP transporter small permease protein n=1 Tax=Bosea vaviloviae TaxID=1526658 RepID=A0A1D7U822_9HYPH|nr:TRAP transporter small permease [Bosea vaviloviae]AOO83541.1 C4-dicarboxylate ABC transporter permease [Bosea vaviloviae]
MMRRSLDALYLWSGYAAGGFLILIFVLMMSLSLGREIGFNIPAGDDFASWCMAAMAFLGLAHTFKSGDMIRVGLLIDRFEGRTRWCFETFSLVLGLGFAGFFAWHAAVMTWQSYEFTDIAGGVVPMPMWIPQLGYSGGLIILFIAMLDEFVHVVLRGQAPRYEKPPAQSDEEIVERAMASGV